MKTLNLYINESLSSENIKSLEGIIKLAEKHYNLDIKKPFFFMSRIPKKKEIHIYPCQDKQQLEEYFEKTIKTPLEFGRFQAIRQTKEDFQDILKMYWVKKDHYKIIEEQ